MTATGQQASDVHASGNAGDDAGEDTVRIKNIDLHDRPQRNVKGYFDTHRDFNGLHATTSCFSVWKDHGNTNGYGKVIPAARIGSGASKTPNGQPLRIFFFDDNIDFSGCESNSSGICNLRDLETGAFVPFAVGKSGFKDRLYSEHTVIHWSDEYNTVLVKVNILDAMVNPEFFTEVIKEYSRPGEKVIAYVDINCTVVFSDVMTGKDKFSVLLSTMFEWIELRPSANSEIKWENFPPVKIKEGQPITLKKLVKKAVDAEGYNHFWFHENCMKFLIMIMGYGTIYWSGGGEVQLDVFEKQYEGYGKVMDKHVADTGIVSAWYTMVEKALIADDDSKPLDPMAPGPHLVMINTFGVDSRKLVLATLDKEEKVTLTTVNYEKWSMRDMKRYEAQYSLGHY
jgi:hypothetical protein